MSVEPARKKQRVVEEALAPDTSEEPMMDTTTLIPAAAAAAPAAAIVVDDHVEDVHTMDNNSIDDLWAAHEKAILDLSAALTTQLEETPPSVAAATTNAVILTQDTTCTLLWLQLKSIQRQVLTRLATTMTQVDTQRQALERSSAVLDNILYEQAYWQQQIRQCQDFETLQLERMCRDEQRPIAGVVGAVGEDSLLEMMNAFLCPSTPADRINNTTTITTTTPTTPAVSFTNPHFKTRILAKLQQEIHLRGSLERDLKEWKRQLSNGKRQVQSKQSLVKELPQKLVEIERSSRALQRLFHTNAAATAATAAAAAFGNQHNNSSSQSSAENASNHPSTVHLIGTERRERLDMAQQLPGPLYTLSVHLQHILDATPIAATLSSSSSAAATTAAATTRNVLSLEIKPTPPLTTTTTNANLQVADRVVLLHVPIPEVSSNSSSNIISNNASGRGSPLTSTNSSKKVVTIQFSYSMQPSCVMAKAYVSSSLDGVMLDTTTLLDELFPNDTGDCTATTTASSGSADCDDDDDNNNRKSTVATAPAAASALYGKPYHWCNYMAGLHFPLEHDESEASPRRLLQQQQQRSSTRVVICELMRRIRAQVVLNYLLSHFRLRKPNPIPVHAALESFFVGDQQEGSATTSAAGAQLVKFQDVSQNHHHLGNDASGNSATKRNKHQQQPKVFAFTIQHGTATCQGTVAIDTVRYPAIPPVWSLQSPSSTTGTGPTNQAASISSLQDGTNPVYDEGLAKLEHSINDEELESLIQPDVEETFDWILAHQLRLLIQKWDLWQLTRRSGDAASNSASHNSGGARVCRGRDRTSVVS